MSDAQLYRSKDEVEEYKKLILLPSFRLNKDQNMQLKRDNSN
jgi:hypothetical protein